MVGHYTSYGVIARRIKNMRPTITGDESHQDIENVIGSLHSQNDLLPVTSETGIRSGRCQGLDHDGAVYGDGRCDDSLQLLQEHLPDGSVYRWAAKLGGASLSDAMLGWIVLLVRFGRVCVVCCDVYNT